MYYQELPGSCLALCGRHRRTSAVRVRDRLVMEGSQHARVCVCVCTWHVALKPYCPLLKASVPCPTHLAMAYTALFNPDLLSDYQGSSSL